MSGLLMRRSLAAGPYGVREDRIQIGNAGSKPSANYWFFRSRLIDRLPLPRSCVLLPTSPGSFSDFCFSPFAAAQAAVRTW